MQRYFPKRKAAVLRKMAPPHNMTVAKLALEEGISDQRYTIGVSRPEHKEPFCRPIQPCRTSGAVEETFRAVLETAPMTEAELSEYCRHHGLYPEQIEAWKAACISGNEHADQQAKYSRQAVRPEKRRKSIRISAEPE